MSVVAVECLMEMMCPTARRTLACLRPIDPDGTWLTPLSGLRQPIRASMPAFLIIRPHLSTSALRKASSFWSGPLLFDGRALSHLRRLISDDCQRRLLAHSRR